MEATAAQKVLELVKDESSLADIARIKEQLVKEKSTVEYQLHKISKVRYEDVYNCLELVSSTTGSVQSLREKLRNVDRLSQENRSSSERYQIINDVTRIHELLGRTSDIYNRIVKFTDFCGQIESYLDAEIGQDALESGCPRLLQIHYMLTCARDFQEQMTVMANVSTEDVQRTMKKVFAKLPAQIEKFDKMLARIIFDLLEAVRTENKSLIIRVCKIIDYEDREDKRISKTREIIKTKELEMESNKIRKLPTKMSRIAEDSKSQENKYPTEQALFEEIMNGTIQTRTLPRGYREFFFSTIRKSIAELFVDVRKEYAAEKQFDVLENLDWIFNELVIAKDHLCRLCPSEWDIFRVYYTAYYEELNGLITELINSEPESLYILSILDFDKNFTKTLKKDFGFGKDEIVSIIGEEQKAQLLQDYLQLIVNKMREWLDNLEKAELQIFLERTTPPHTDSENLLFLEGTKTCFQMFTQQVEVAAGSGQAKILVGVVERFCKLLFERQSHWMQAISSEVKKCLQYNHKYEKDPDNIAQEEECAGGLVEYLVAVANDQMKAADYAVAISQKYGSMVSKVHERTITNRIEETLDGFAEVAKCSNSGLVALIFDDLRRPYAEIFSKAWYSGNQAQQIADTLYEYLADIRSQMNPFVYSTLVESVIEETILQFLAALHHGHAFRNKQNKFLDCMKRDFEIFYKLFVQFVSDEDKLLIDDKFKLMEFFMDFACSPLDVVPDTWAQCLHVYWDTPAALLQAVLACRKDVDSPTAKRLLADAQAAAADPKRLATLKNQDLQPTFISRFT
ncbi:ACL047Wp [Eremothecium gossypii ATCC 10895]|uniref:ACL047Wp n=1 Tax=Eremothecium gossypii (strain ATCC 10895 / CBS 109.51 / FGSC 9923 / NRRL Y-1056) TaxID=284811 RepID=Q75CG6_EREGS|nr:ACL047Wp [Eremothecium gossypii ATCC 10895]AAS51181.2 ACL047Wp [Eremothecium gossypii ATCC 10895]AEY95472.1 FACL047Wp [Eremothecium gossypii FDAG1]